MTNCIGFLDRPASLCRNPISPVIPIRELGGKPGLPPLRLRRRLRAESSYLHAAPTNGVVRHKPMGSASLWERNEFGLVAGHLREAAFLPVLLGLLDPVL
jgi:hypothetical protein